jgi:hypothetical protein
VVILTHLGYVFFSGGHSNFDKYRESLHKMELYSWLRHWCSKNLLFSNKKAASSAQVVFSICPGWTFSLFLVLSLAGCQSCTKGSEDNEKVRTRAKSQSVHSNSSPTPSPLTEESDIKENTQTNTNSALAEPITLATLEISAFGKTIGVDDSTVYLLSPEGFWRFSPEHKPVETRLDLGYAHALTDVDIVFWSRGAMHALAKQGGNPRELGPVPNKPRTIMAHGSHFAWLDLSEGGTFSFRILQKGVPRILYRTVNKVTSSIMLNQRIYFVEQSINSNETNPPPRWRIGGVSTDPKNSPVFGPWQRGRTPSMLGGYTDIYYYDLPARSVYRLSPDLAHTETIATKTVCTPFTVSDRLLCSRVEGLFEVSKDGAYQKILTDKPMGLTTNLAASKQLVAWTSDVGEDQLALRVLPLGPLPKKGKSQKKSSQ